MAESSHLFISTDGAERVPLKTFTEKAYLDYSMYVLSLIHI